MISRVKMEKVERGKRSEVVQSLWTLEIRLGSLDSCKRSQCLGLKREERGLALESSLWLLGARQEQQGATGRNTTARRSECWCYVLVIPLRLGRQSGEAEDQKIPNQILYPHEDMMQTKEYLGGKN